MKESNPEWSPAREWDRISEEYHNDMVNHPQHYTTGKVECLDAIQSALGDGYKYYLQGAIIKYIWRYEHKGKAAEDLAKLQFYLNRLQFITGENDEL